MLRSCFIRSSSFPFYQTLFSLSTRRFSGSPLHCDRHGPRRTHYEVLGLKHDASTVDIRAAFVKLSKEVHPDKNPNDPQNHSKFVFLNEAYTILSKPQSRKEYDVSLAHWLHIQQSMARSGYSSHTAAGNEPTPGFGRRQESYEGCKNKGFKWFRRHVRKGSQERVFWDETIWYMRDRSKDAGAFYDKDSYYGIKGIRRQSNSTIVAICLVIIACGFVYFFAAFKYTSKKQRERLETIDRKRLRFLIETRERARQNGTAKQLEILNARHSAGRMNSPIQKSEEEP